MADLYKDQGRYGEAEPLYLRSRAIEPAPHLVCGSVHALPFAEACFDAVVLVCVLGELPDRVNAFRECQRVLRPGGTLAVTEALPDPGYVRGAVIERLAAHVGLQIGERRGSWVQATHCFRTCLPASPVPPTAQGSGNP